MTKNISYAILLVSIIFLSCKQEKYIDSAEVMDPEYFHKSYENLTDIMVHDIFSPPVASRNYMYPSIAAYEALRYASPDEYKSLAGQVKDLSPLPQPDTTKRISYTIASLEALNIVGKALIFSEQRVEDYVTEMYGDLKSKGVPNDVMKNSIAFGEQIASHILEWADGDNYKQTRTFPKFSITQEDARWKPTPPAYMDGIEPHWNKVRPLILDSAQQFIPTPPTAFSTDKNSKFYEEVMEVYNTVNDADEDQKEIAAFWDCNPFVMNVTGHVMHATKKITPGGHWIGIVGVATRKANVDLLKMMEAYTITSIALYDGFISCWDEKYRSNLTRPETVINENYDPDWIPLLQTPPFPEHTSGHSVISRAAATALTSVYGDDFEYEDDVELKYGLPVRKFKSFYQASEEAAISRLYGGIHYRPAIDYGVQQGQKVGDLVVEKLTLGIR